MSALCCARSAHEVAFHSSYHMLLLLLLCTADSLWTKRVFKGANATPIPIGFPEELWSMSPSKMTVTQLKLVFAYFATRHPEVSSPIFEAYRVDVPTFCGPLSQEGGGGGEAAAAAAAEPAAVNGEAAGVDPGAV